MDKDSRPEAAVSQLLALWESGELPGYVEKSVIRRRYAKGSTRPSDSWSVGNLILMLLGETDDARGFRQWQEVGRRVKKGAKAIYIFGPVTRKVERENPDTGGIEQARVVVGFRLIPVFRVEDTEGEPIEVADYTPVERPPLMEVAEAWAIDVRYAPFNGRYYGCFDLVTQKITLGTHQAKTFFHELAHAAHNRITPLKGGQVVAQEVVAETAAAALSLLYGFEPGEQSEARSYVASYAGTEPERACKAVMQCLSEIQAVLDLILTTAAEFGRRDLPTTIAA